MVQGLSAPEKRLVPTSNEHEPFYKQMSVTCRALVLNLVILHTGAMSGGNRQLGGWGENTRERPLLILNLAGGSFLEPKCGVPGPRGWQ